MGESGAVGSTGTVTQIASNSPNRLLVASNRLPVVLRKEDDGWSSETGSGGLVSAMMPVLRDRGGVWVGWPGVVEEESALNPYLESLSKKVGYGLEGVYLTEPEVKGFYEGFSNKVIWPLFHDLPVDCCFDPAHWQAYRQVNRKFAQKIADIHQPGDVIWVHDYHLVGVGAGLRRHGLKNSIGFFLHIPFPPPDIFLKLPWRADIISGLLEYDLIGFQTMRDRRNFQRCLRALYKVEVKGKGQVLSVKASPLSQEVGTPSVTQLRVGSFPISIDYDHYSNLSTSPPVEEILRRFEATLNHCKMILSVDRLDYTKGLINKLLAFRLALKRYPSMRNQAVLCLHVVPSRATIPEYHRLRKELEQLISEINGAFSQPGWIPIHYYYHSLTPEELSAYYRRADIMFVNPLKDGMNLVCKEYCASRPDNDGVLILSEFAGAAAELQKGALLINPYDTERVAQRLHDAMTLDKDEARRRMRILRRKIKQHDIYRWVNAYLHAIAGRDLDDFPKIEDYVPSTPPEDKAVHLYKGSGSVNAHRP